MYTYIATFYSHFAAMQFQRLCGSLGVAARLMPVPRSLSSSCGTCVRFSGSFATRDIPEPLKSVEEMEQIVSVTEDGRYIKVIDRIQEM